MPEHYIALGR